MKLSALALVAACGIWSVAAQVQAPVAAKVEPHRHTILPKCSHKCFDNAVKKLGICDLDDGSCWCEPEHLKKIRRKAGTCIFVKCRFKGPGKVLSTVPKMNKYCKKVAEFKTGESRPSNASVLQS
ncbi:Extracellular membrane protein, CFEM domain protein [Cordyceps fumosorosea ARSEF 2679]|uniref:Extracellular membrane protein, CFEM domain protein n=1 Tax=Cordyceps fumosorosea (strain ARSEF 2679) TaxID=1081104 RepID=A0A168BLP5_CORFA|nr:Extracellular membrane protein, CFEM domain protein [Cordyceps fumosorosea ARSEF 2679]OAA70280.1 Extracellular membrane protein, CFEM domain protein [Cordyceps fumosorosea ARSEF 2679]